MTKREKINSFKTFLQSSESTAKIICETAEKKYFPIIATYLVVSNTAVVFRYTLFDDGTYRYVMMEERPNVHYSKLVSIF